MLNVEILYEACPCPQLKEFFHQMTTAYTDRGEQKDRGAVLMQWLLDSQKQLVGWCVSV